MPLLSQFAPCIGLPRQFSIVSDVFGYASPPLWKMAVKPDGSPQPGLPPVLSLATQIQRLGLKQFALNVIRVGTDPKGLLSPAQEENLDCAIQVTRDIFSAAGIGIGRVERWWLIPLSDNTGFEVIDDNDEAEELVESFTVPHGGVDVFFVKEYVGGTAGLFPWKGDGIVVESRLDDFLGTGRTMAHELGHFFGLGHENDDPTNLMCQSDPALKLPLGAHLNPDQVEEIMEKIGPPCNV
jgi:hypothetical protein